MSIASLCRREIVTIDAQASLRQAATRMREHHVGALVVTSDVGGVESVVGMLTDRDLAIEVLARDLNPADLRVGQLARRELAAVPGNAGTAQAIALMRDAGVRRLLVTDGEGRVIGLVAADDLVEALATELTGLAGALRSGIARETSEKPPVAAARPVFLAHGTPGMQQPVEAHP